MGNTMNNKYMIFFKKWCEAMMSNFRELPEMPHINKTSSTKRYTFNKETDRKIVQGKTRRDWFVKID